MVNYSILPTSYKIIVATRHTDTALHASYMIELIV